MKKPKAMQIPPINSVNAIKYAKKTPVKTGFEYSLSKKFIKLSRDVHFLNDDRAKIKLEMNNHTGSSIKEIKEYTSY